MDPARDAGSRSPGELSRTLSRAVATIDATAGFAAGSVEIRAIPRRGRSQAACPPAIQQATQQSASPGEELLDPRCRTGELASLPTRVCREGSVPAGLGLGCATGRTDGDWRAIPDARWSPRATRARVGATLGRKSTPATLPGPRCSPGGRRSSPSPRTDRLEGEPASGLARGRNAVR